MRFCAALAWLCCDAENFLGNAHGCCCARENCRGFSPGMQNMRYRYAFSSASVHRRGWL